jgi:DNA-binding NarL/FixJ family response regulator
LIISKTASEFSENGMRVFIADSRSEARIALMMYLHQEPGVNITGMAVETQGLLAQVEAIQPDVVLLDWHLPGQPVTDVLAELKKLEQRPRIIVLSVRPEVESEAMAAGADAVVSKAASPDRLVAVLHKMVRQTP